MVLYKWYPYLRGGEKSSMKSIVLALAVTFLFGSLAIAGDTLIVAYDGQIDVCRDVEGDQKAECETTWLPKGGSDKKFTALAEDNYGRLYAGTQDGLMTFKPIGQKYLLEMHHRGLRTPKVIIPNGEKVWIGSEAGPLVEMSFSGTAISNETSQFNLPIADTHDTSCLQSAWHWPTQSFLCVGPLNGVDGEPLMYGLWVVPNTWMGLDWSQKQLYHFDEREPLSIKPIGLVSDKENVYVLVIDNEVGGNVKNMSLLRMEFGRNGFGPFSKAKIGVVGYDLNADITQPMAVASDGRLFITYYEEAVVGIDENAVLLPLWSVWLIDPEQRQLPQLFLRYEQRRIGAIVVRK